MKKREHAVEMKAESSKGNERGTFVDSRTGIEGQHWSGVEHRLQTVLRADPAVAEVWTQEPTVDYFDEDGVARTHRWDCLSKLVNGEWVVYNVKPLSERDEVMRLFKLFLAQGHPHGYAHHMRYVSDAMLSDNRVHNARETITSRENHNHVDYLEALLTLNGRSGRVLLDDLLKGSSNEGDRRVALFRLIDTGVLVHCGSLHDRIERYSYFTIEHTRLQEELQEHVGYHP